MAESESGQERLFGAFPEVNTAAWEEVIVKDLKGKDYNKKLVWRPLEGFEVRPYYRREDLEKLTNTDTKPGEYPYIRGNHQSGNPWLIRQDIKVFDFAQANARARQMVAKGADAIGFVFTNTEVPSKQDFVTLLQEINPLETEVNLLHLGKSDQYLPPFREAVAELGDAWRRMHGSIGFGPLSWLTLRGKLCQNHGGPWARAKAMVEFRREFTGLQTLSVDGVQFNFAGATAVEELAYSLSMAVEYIAQLTEQGLDAAEVAKSIRFNFAVGSLYFMEMAKLRAARWLWARIVEAYGVHDAEAQKMCIHAETTRWNQTVYDPYVNMLRGTTEGMSAILAGVHSLTVVPFNTPYEESNDFSDRMARNAQIILRDEAYFNRVADPAGGSYYVETLTASVAKAAWEEFERIEAAGGFLAAFKEGIIQKHIGETAATRRKRLATRRDTLVGTNQFPNFTERAKPEEIEQVRSRSCGCGCGCQSGSKELYEPLQPFRGAEEFEALRMATDASAHRPKAFMLTLGNLAMRRARAQFSCNFLACAGFEVIDNVGFESIAAGLAAAREAGAQIIVLCSSDEEYAELGPATFKELREGELFIVAGAPECQADLEAVGIRHFISVKSNLLETLRELQHEVMAK